jgi:hypothetical protein
MSFNTSMCMETTSKKRIEFVGKHSNQGNRIIIIIPKEHQDSISKLKNPMLVTVEEIL